MQGSKGYCKKDEKRFLSNNILIDDKYYLLVITENIQKISPNGMHYLCMFIKMKESEFGCAPTVLHKCATSVAHCHIFSYFLRLSFLLKEK